MRRLLFAVPVVLVPIVFACVGDDPAAAVVTPGVDGATDGGPSTDTSTPTDSSSPPVDSGDAGVVDAALCNPAAAFGAPVSVAELNTGDPEDGVTLSADELTVYFTSLGTLKQGTRASKSVAFSNIATVAVANQPDTHTPFLTHDGQVLYMSVGAGAPAFFYSVFSAGGFAAPIAVSGSASGPFYGSDPFLNSERSRAYWSFPTIPDGGGSLTDAIYKTSIFMPSAWGTRDLIGELWSSQGDRSPVVSQDELTMFFASARLATNFDVWVSKRGSIGATWGVPTKVAALSSVEDDFPGWLSDDGCRMYLISRKTGNLDIHLAKRGL